MSDEVIAEHAARSRRRTAEAIERANETAAARAQAAIRQAGLPGASQSNLRQRIDQGLAGDPNGIGLARYIAREAGTSDRASVAVARQLLYVLEGRHSDIVRDPEAAAAVVRLARLHVDFGRPRCGFETDHSASAFDQVKQLAAHLLVRWPVPGWLHSVWFNDDGVGQSWYAHLGAGRNLAAAPDLPFPLTKRMAHFAVLAPAQLSWPQAVRWGQLRSVGVPEGACEELVSTSLRATPLPDEPFWLSVGRWFAAHPESFGHATEIVDYLFAQRIGYLGPPAQPGLTMADRDPDRLLADVREWHREVNRQLARQGDAPAEWPSCGIAGFDPVPDRCATPPGATGGPPAWAIVELVTCGALADEGAALQHCVATYATAAAAGRSAIFSLRRRGDDGIVRPAVTVEVWPEQMQIVQAKATENAAPSDADRRLIEQWAAVERLTVARLAFG